MEFQLCQNEQISYSNNDCYLIIQDLWNISSNNNSMDNHEEYFNWTNELRIEDDKCNRDREESVIESKFPRKRKLSPNAPELFKIKNANGFKSTRNAVCDLEESEKADTPKKSNTTNGTSKMPSWQVDDISDLNADLEGSLTALGGGDLSNNSYNMNSDSILAGLPVFKQEAPSPTSNEVTVLQQAKQNRHSPTCIPISQSQPTNTRQDGQTNQNIFNNTLHHLLGTSTYSNISIDGNNRSSNPLSLDNYQINGHSLAEDCRFQYVLAAATSIATKVNEDTLTYLNQGQSYEIKLKKLGDLSTYRGKLLKTIIKICFHERRLQYMEKEQMTLWQQSRPGDRILEVDVPLSYGLYDVVQPSNALNSVIFSWDPTKEVGVYIKVNCISTEFTPKKHGGEKGVPFRIQIETYQASENLDISKRLHAAACQIKVFKLKGADRKHKQDREKILKRPISEQEKYQPSYDCTVLTDIPYEAVISNLSAEPQNNITSPYSPESRNNNQTRSNNHLQTQIEDNNLVKTNPQELSPVPSNDSTYSAVNTNVYNTVGEPLMSGSIPQMTTHWLTMNRFEKHLATFANFSGADMLRMSRDDLIQICGHADGIRLYNALHSKTIDPKLTIYVCRENTSVFNAIFLSAHNNIELLQKLALFTCIPQEQVRDIYMQGPQSIHVHLSNDVIKHIKDETMFSLEVVQDNSSYIFILKPMAK